MTLKDRVAEVEYFLFRDPKHARETKFGTFISDPEFPDRYDCNQLFNCRCPGDKVHDLLQELDRLYAGKTVGYRKISGHDDETRAALEPILTSQGWRFGPTSMMVLSEKPQIAPNPEVEIKAVDPFHPDLEIPYSEKRGKGKLDRGFIYYRTHKTGVGGEWLIGYLDGQPAGTAGWYAVGGVAGTRWIGTRGEFRRRGVAASLILHMQAHPEVKAQDAFSILCNSEPAIRLYEKLGFRHIGWMWDAIKFD